MPTLISLTNVIEVFSLTPVISHFILGEVQKWKQKRILWLIMNSNMSMQFVCIQLYSPYAIISGKYYSKQ